MRLSLEDQMEVSALLGIPLVDLACKSEDFLRKVHALVRHETANPRMAVVLMSIAFLYHVKLAAKEKGDLFEDAHRALILAATLIDVVLEDEK